MCLLLLAACISRAQDSSSTVEEKLLYTTDFSDWGDYETSAKTTVTTVPWATKYSHEDLTFSVYNTQIGASNFNTSKFPDWEGGMLMAAKSSDPYVETTALASITKVHFLHGATGSNRGWQLWAKGDGDEDWVSVSNSVASTATGTDVTVNINRTNCQLKFTNLNSAQNAYLFELDIYGNVDMSAFPSLGSFTANGITYNAEDIFSEDNDGNMAGAIEVSKSESIISAENPLTDVTASNGEITSITYTTTGSGADTKTVATILITANEVTSTYLLTITYKPDYTVTYVNTDGTTIGTQAVEKDAAVGTFAYTESNVTVADGKKFRGWFEEEDGGRKFTEEEVITADTYFYAVATDIETANGSARYTFNLTDKYFYDEDHEAFNATNAAFYNSSHGWMMNQSSAIDLLVGGHAYIMITACQYSAGKTATLTDEAGNTYTATFPTGKDGQVVSMEYTGSAGTITLTVDGTSYLHRIVIANVEDNPVQKNEQGYYVVNAGDVNHFLTTLELVNAASGSDRQYIFLPDGTYDLGEEVLTPVSRSNISIIGQSMEGTIIKNAPDISVEGIGTTATLYVTGTATYFQDLTLQNALDYYNSGSAGRAVCLQDKGTKTICKNVRMLSYQDTYYSNNNSGKFYWEDSEIHGTVDFLCGGGDVYYNRCKFVVEQRSADGSGGCTIAAPYTDGSTWGYVMESCTIDNYAQNFNFGRAWGGKPRLAYLNTTLLQPNEITSTRFTTSGMNVAADKFVEYNSVDENGNVVSPESNILTFTHSTGNNQMETILTADEAATYTLDNVFTTWSPDEEAAQKSMGTITVTDNTLSWEAVDGAMAYAIFNGDTFVEMTSSTSYIVTEGNVSDYKVRAANAMGGFGVAAGSTTGISNISSDNSNVINSVYYNLSGSRVNDSYKGIVIKVDTLSDGTQKATKIIK